jgi:hypothetical protein
MPLLRHGDGAIQTASSGNQQRLNLEAGKPERVKRIRSALSTRRPHRSNRAHRSANGGVAAASFEACSAFIVLPHSRSQIHNSLKRRTVLAMRVRPRGTRTPCRFTAARFPFWFSGFQTDLLELRNDYDVSASRMSTRANFHSIITFTVAQFGFWLPGFRIHLLAASSYTCTRPSAARP